MDLGPGEGVGELGLIDRQPRSATVVAIEPTATLELHALAFATLANSSSRFYELLARRLGERLRATDELLELRLHEPKVDTEGAQGWVGVFAVQCLGSMLGRGLQTYALHDQA